jgi:hypothetical protein
MKPEIKEFVDPFYMFPDHAQVFFITRRDVSLIDPLMKVLAASPSKQETQSHIQSIVEQFRPELKNCVVHSLSYSAHHGCWELGVSHPSLPEIGNYGEELLRERLIPETWMDRLPLL